MNYLSLKEVHDADLDILRFFDGFCSDNGLRYYLAYGTLLGAVRHRGFIPWDDDVDIWMPRSDFEQFAKKFNGNDRFLFIPPFSEGYAFTWAKIVDKRTGYRNDHRLLPSEYGLSADIFILDDDLGSESFSKLVKLVRRSYEANQVYRRYSESKSKKILAKRVLQTRFKLMPERRYSKDAFYQLLAIASENNRTENYIEYLPNYKPKDYERARLKKDLFDDGVRAPFEGFDFVVPCNAEKVLDQLYGADWRTPREWSHATAHAFWR